MIHKIIENKLLSSTTRYLKISRENLLFQPGACVDIIIGDIRKTYSIASGINDDYLEFYIRLFDNGKMSNAITHQYNKLELGDISNVFTPGINGDKESYCYIATGTGIAPFLSALKSYNHKPEIILYGARTYYDIINHLYLKNNFDCIFTVSKDNEHADKFKLRKGRVTDYLNYIPIIPNLGSREFSCKYYLCGINTMIDDVSSYLTNNGVSPRNIQHEQFYQKQD